MTQIELPSPSRRRTSIANLIFSYAILTLTIIQGFALVPLYLSRIPVPLYGAWLATGNVLAWLGLVDPGLSAVLQQRIAFYYGARDTKRLAALIGTGLALTSGLAALSLASWFVAEPVSRFVRAPPDVTLTLIRSFHLAVLSMAVGLASQGVGSVNLGLQLAIATGGISVVGGVVGIVFTIVLLLLGYGLVALPAGMLARAAIIFIGNGVTLWWWCNRYLRIPIRFDPAELKDVGKVMVFTFCARLGATLLYQMDALMTARLLSPTAAAVITLTGRAHDVVRMAGERVGQSLMPALSHLDGEGRRTRISEVVADAGRIVGWSAAVGVGIVVALNEDFVRVWVGPQLFGGQGLTATLAIATAVSLFVVMQAQIVVALGNIQKASVLGIVEAAVKLPLQVVMTRIFGLVGMPLGSVIASIGVSGWFLPRVVADSLCERRSKHIHLWALRLAFVLGLVGVGLLGHAALSFVGPAVTWAGIVPRAVVVVIAFGCIPLIIDRVVRTKLISLIKLRLGWLIGK